MSTRRSARRALGGSVVPIHGICTVLDLNVQRDDAAQPDVSCSPHFELSRLSRVVYACMAFSLLLRIYFS